MSLNDRLSSHPSARLSSRVLHAAILVFICGTMLFLGAPLAQAQSAGTGALTGTVTDASGASVPNVTVTATSKATNQSRSMTTASDGGYKFSLLPPGTYTLKFSVANFKTSEVTAVTVAVTETQTIDKVLEVGAITEKVTVEANVETIQTESSTLGTTVSGNTITALPMANGNYTQILSLSAGASAGVANATSLGKGTQDISANGVNAGSNNYQMDGVAVNNIANSGSSNDGTIYTGIPIPSPDAIAEFKIQTSTFDASYGRNPGANVNVVTKSGTNNFHGTAFEFFRNSVLNADDFFYPKHNPGAPPHQVLDQNQFGGTIGGPIKKDKLFFFFSYRGTRAKNGVAAAGTTFGARLPLTLNGFGAPGARGTCPAPAPGDSVASCSATAQAFATFNGIINVVGLRIFQLPGVGGQYYLPSPDADTKFCNGITGVCNFSIPALYRENQYVANGDWLINSKQTLAMRYFYTLNPQSPFLGQNGGNLPGTPEHIIFGNQAAVLKLTSIVTNSFVNEARVSFQRNTDNSSISMPVGGTNQPLGITPGTGGFTEPPVYIDILDGFTLFGGLLPNFGPTNQTQVADQISWQHGKHSIRAGYEYEGTNWPLLDSGLNQGLLLGLGTDGLAKGGNAGPFWNVGCLFCVESIGGENGITHSYRVRNQNAYVLDDWKVSSRLTLNIGLRWEYDGLLSDKFGRLTQVHLDRMAASVPATLAAALTDPTAIRQYVVASNFPKFFGPPPAGVAISSNQHSIDGHAPYSNFGPRFGFAWQPLKSSKLVVRGGAGIFYNRVGLDSVVHAFEQGAPYAQTYDYNIFGARWFAATLANPYPALNLVPLASNPTIGFAPRFAHWNTGEGDPLPTVNSGLSTPLSYIKVHTPLVQEYSLGIQYEFARAWVLDLGYVGSTGINLNDYNHNHNQARLATPTNSLSSFCDGGSPNICNTSVNVQFRVPVLGYEAAGLAASDSDGYSNYNSLQVTVRHQFSQGLSMQAAYTWDKNLSTIFIGQSANINSSLNMNGQYGRVSFDRPQRLSVNFSYDLPFGKGMQGAAGRLVNGWNVSGVTIAQSGDPLTFIAPNVTGTAFGTSTTGVLSGVSTAQFCSGGNNGNAKAPGGTKANLGNYWNSAAFGTIVDSTSVSGLVTTTTHTYTPCPSAPVPFGAPGLSATAYGNSGVGGVLGPGQFNWDISLLKNTKITERVNMQFRAEFYNAFNHPQFSDPGAGSFGSIGLENVTATRTVVNSQTATTKDVSVIPTYGIISHTNVNPRLIQFGLRFTF
jgi:hypothetical protein